MPAGSLFTGLAWFSCKAEGAQYPINQTAMVPYPTLVAQQLRRACKCDTFSQLCARALLTEKASAFQTMRRFHSRTGTLGSCSHRCSRAASRKTRSWCCTRACSVPSCLPPLSVVAVAWLLALLTGACVGRDHGYQLGERNIWCKETCFNLATHVPLMIRSPAHASSHGARSSAMVELVVSRAIIAGI